MTRLDLSSITSLLFVPGDRPDRFQKGRDTAAGAIILDLEDAVALAKKDFARQEVGLYLAAQRIGAPVLARLNPFDTAAGLADLQAAAAGQLSAAGIALPKVESPRDIAILRSHMSPDIAVCALIETATGLHEIDQICGVLRPGDALALGGADLVVDLDARFGWDGLLSGRQTLVNAAARHRLSVFDVPWLDIRDEAGLAHETARVRDLGFSGRLAIHPAQVPVINEVFRPSDADIRWAEAVQAAMRDSGGAAVQVNGKLVDEPVRIQAARILARR